LRIGEARTYPDLVNNCRHQRQIIRERKSRRGALPWAPGARQQLVQSQAEIEDVGTVVDFEAAHLLTIVNGSIV
jgi:hypothetical protein